MQHDAWFFIGVFAFIFLLWVATGGPTHPISFAGPYLSQPQPLGSGSYIGLPRAPFAIGNSNTVLGNPQEGLGGSYSSGGSNGYYGSLSGVTFGPPSTYRGSVQLSHYVSSPGNSDPDQEYVQIYLSQGAAPVTISGWTLESEATANAAVIPQGTEVPMSGTIQALQAVTLRPGDTAIIETGSSPIGASFRENKCIGYFAQYQKFSPSFSNSCPDPQTELEQFYPGYIRDARCIDYVKSLSRCTIALSPPAGSTSACQSFLESYLNYNGCVQAHQNDSDFKGTTWRVYLGKSSAMWRTQNEVVKLLDASGKTVDAFSY